MSDLQNLIDQMIERVEQEVSKELIEAKSKADILLVKAEHQLEEKQRAERQKIDEEQKQQYELELNAYKVQLRNQLLAKKQAIFNECFEAAKVKMSSWNQKEYQTFVKLVLEKLQPKKEAELILGDRSRGLVSKEWLAEFTQKKGYALRLSSKNVPNEAGFVLRTAGVDYNFCFSSLLLEQKEDLVPILATELFS